MAPEEQDPNSYENRVFPGNRLPMGPPPPPTQDQVLSSLPFSKADDLQLQRLQSGLTTVSDQLLSGEISPELASHYKDRINSQLAPLQKRKMASTQQQMQQQIHTAMQQQAMTESVAAVGRKYRAQGFQDGVVPFTNPVTGETAYMYEAKPSHWEELKFERDANNRDRAAEGGQALSTGVENWNPFADLAMGAAPSGGMPPDVAEPPTDVPEPPQEMEATPAQQEPESSSTGGDFDTAEPQHDSVGGDFDTPQQQPPKPAARPPLDLKAIWDQAARTIPLPRGRGPGGRFLNPRMADQAMRQWRAQVAHRANMMYQNEMRTRAREDAVNEAKAKEARTEEARTKREEQKAQEAKEERQRKQEQHDADLRQKREDLRIKQEQHDADKKQKNQEADEKRYDEAYKRFEHEEGVGPDGKPTKTPRDPDKVHQMVRSYLQERDRYLREREDQYKPPISIPKDLPDLNQMSPADRIQWMKDARTASAAHSQGRIQEADQRKRLAHPEQYAANDAAAAALKSAQERATGKEQIIQDQQGYRAPAPIPTAKDEFFRGHKQ